MNRFAEFLGKCRQAGIFEADDLRETWGDNLPEGEDPDLGYDPVELTRVALRKSIKKMYAEQGFHPRTVDACLKTALNAFEQRLPANGRRKEVDPE